ncbi:MAG: ComEA family DNA-binding protein [Gammaproteobacteria bacterium]|jgi:competence protein ComEA
MSQLRSILLWLALACCPVAAFAGTVNLNTADAQTLAANLVGVGPDKAAAIVSYRQANGPFHQPGDLAKVKGIGERTVERNLDRISVQPPGKAVAVQ